MTQYRYSARETNRVTARGLSSVEISNVKTCRLGLASHFHERLTHVALYENRAKRQLLIANIKNEKLEKTDTYSYYKMFNIMFKRDFYVNKSKFTAGYHGEREMGSLAPNLTRYDLVVTLASGLSRRSTVK